MKFEDLLMQPSEEKHTQLQLQQQVERLEEELDGELQMKRVLQCAMQGPVGCCDSCSCLSTFLPFQVQMLLAELALVEEEIDWLEREVHELKSDIHKEKQDTRKLEISPRKEFQPRWEQRQLKKLPSRRPNQVQHKEHDVLSSSQNYENRRYKIARERRASVGSSMELQGTTSLRKYGKSELPLPLI